MRHEGLAPSAWVSRWARLVPPGEVLDLACGAGRHARLFAGLGHTVVAVDRDAQGLAELAGVPGVRTLAADLEVDPWPLAGQQFAGVVVTHYLYRPLFAPILDAVAPGGVLIYETFAVGNERLGKPSNPAFLLRSGELLQAFAGQLQVVAFEQGRLERPRPAVVQRLCARRAEDSEARLDA